MRKPGLTAAVLALALCGHAAAAAPGAAEQFQTVVPFPPLLRAFLYRMPKGADLHVHLSGAAYAEAMINAAIAADTCVSTATMKIVKPPCAWPDRRIAEAIWDATFHRSIIDAWSMRDFVRQGGTSGHDHFFDAFGLFGGAALPGDMAADVVDRAGRQRMRYIELMVTFQGQAIADKADAAGKACPWDETNPTCFEAALRAAFQPEVLAAAGRDIDALEQRMNALLQCGTPQARPGCGVTVRWLQQVRRTEPPHRVFASSLFGALLQAGDKRVVGLNFVASEDDPRALADYQLQMRMLDYLYGRMPQTNIALHAGELTLGLVPPGDLLFHIRAAVEHGHAKRIGHGVDIMYEDDPFGLLQEMADRRVAVEINLTSNAQILGVQGMAHPFPIYHRAGVPVVLSTDDEGVERVDCTYELQLAVTTYGLSWSDLIGLERNTLEYAFVPGASLWTDTRTWRMVKACAASNPAGDPAAACAAFLNGSEKATLQWHYEHDLAAFDREVQAMPGWSLATSHKVAAVPARRSLPIATARADMNGRRHPGRMTSYTCPSQR